METFIVYSDEVKKAKEQGLPIVALESTIISHGMPYPENVESARKCEELIRKEGVTPATIAIINGKVHIGLNDDELEYFGKASGIIKVSRRDIAPVLSKKVDGATTVAATMYLASLTGIRVFATGGIGGVHRGAQQSFDISNDLEELARTNVAVVCAGAKSILDIGLTLEVLETKGVEVIGVNTDDFPAFYTRTSGYKVHYNMNEEQIAKNLQIHDELKLAGGTLVANPIPEEYALEQHYILSIIDQANDKATREGVKGKDVTPFLLQTIYEKSEGKSLMANKELVYNNAIVAARIAKGYSQK